MAAQRRIIISEVDHAQLANLFSGESPTRGTDKSSLQTLRGELDIATVVDPEDVPFNVVTLNSTVRLSDSRSSYEDTYTLVYPDDAGDTDSHLSVLDPVGIAILGYRVGDLVEWPFPRGTATFRIKELVFQPERDGIIAWVS